MPLHKDLTFLFNIKLSRATFPGLCTACNMAAPVVSVARSLPSGVRFYCRIRQGILALFSLWSCIHPPCTVGVHTVNLTASHFPRYSSWPTFCYTFY